LGVVAVWAVLTALLAGVLWGALGGLVALRYGPDESWAPTIVGDLLGLAAALLGSLVAVIGAVATRPERAPTAPAMTGA
jgi:hypothetical protein